jgi:hypothetical protein
MNEMRPRLLSSDPYTMTKEWFVPSVDGKEFTIVTEQFADPLLAHNYELRKEADTHTRWGEGQLVASLPPTVWMDLWRKGIIQSETALKKWLNAAENVVFRRRFGRV